MKRTLLITALVFCCYIPLQAQETSLGLSAGASYSSLRGNEIAEENAPAFDYLIGVSLEIPVSEKLSFIPSFNFERKSVKREFEFDNLNILPNPNDPAFRHDTPELKYTLQYISVPLNLRYYIGAQKKFYINGGPYTGFIIGDIIKLDGNRAEEGNSDMYKTVEFGVNFGVGTSFSINESNMLEIELKNNLGLTDISDVQIINNGTLKTNSANLIITWKFKL